MPNTGAIVYALIAGIIGVMVMVIGYLLKRGIDNLTQEVKGLRADTGKYHDSELELRGEVKAFRAECSERHKRIDYEIVDLKQKVG